MSKTLEQLNNEWVEAVSNVLVGHTITKVERKDVSSGVDPTDIIQGYCKLTLEDNRKVLMGVDYEECEFLVCEVDEQDNPVNTGLIYDVCPEVE